MELDRKQKVVVVLVLLSVGLVGLVLAFLLTYLDLLVPATPSLNLPDFSTDTALTRLETVTAELSTLVGFLASQIPGAGIINRGPLIPFDTSKCVTGEVDNCFYQNPATPYTRVAWENELPGFFSTLDVIPLRPNDVIILRGRTPPPCVYWSFVPYLLQGTDVCSSVPVGAGLSDSISNITTGWAPSTPFLMIFGTNSGAISFVKSKLQDAPDAPAQIATQQFAYVGPGLYWLIGRTALFETPSDQDAYLSNTQISGVIARIPEESFDPVFTRTTPLYKPRNAAIDENEVIGTDTYDAQAEAYLESVLDALGGTYTAQDVPIVLAPVLPSGAYDSGASCLAECAECFIDNRDTVYFTGEVENFAPGYYLLVYAVNHSAFGKAIYAQISVYDNRFAVGLDAVEALPQDDAFYQLLISQVTDAPTVPLPSGTQVLTLADSVTDVSIAERAYVQPSPPDTPSFGISAAPETLLPMKVWLLSPA